MPLSTFLRATVSGREGLDMKGKQFKRHVRSLAEELDFNPDHLDRELGVGLSGGEQKLEMLRLLFPAPTLAILDETDSDLDVDALGVVPRGIEVRKRTCEGTLVIITHNARILEHVNVDRVHVLAHGQIVGGGDASLVAGIDVHGFERFERAQEANAALSHESLLQETSMAKQRTEVADIDRNLYGFRNDDADAERLDAGLAP